MIIAKSGAYGKHEGDKRYVKILSEKPEGKLLLERLRIK